MRARAVRFLLVEDNPDHAALVRDTWESRGLGNVLDWVQSGEAALDYLAQRGDYVNTALPDAVFLDINLPGIGGFDVLKAMRATSEWRTVRVIILSTSSADRDLAAATEGGVDGYLVKPMEELALDGVLQDLGFRTYVLTDILEEVL